MSRDQGQSSGSTSATTTTTAQSTANVQEGLIEKVTDLILQGDADYSKHGDAIKVAVLAMNRIDVEKISDAGVFEELEKSAKKMIEYLIKIAGKLAATNKRREGEIVENLMGNIRAFTSKLKDRKKKVDYAKQREAVEVARSITITTPAYVPGQSSRSTTSGYQGGVQQSYYPTTSTRERYQEKGQQFASSRNDDIIVKEESNSNNQPSRTSTEPSVRKTTLYVMFMRVHTGMDVIIAICYVSRYQPKFKFGEESMFINTTVQLSDTDEFVFIDKIQMPETGFNRMEFANMKREPDPEKYLLKIYLDTWYGLPIGYNPNQEGFYASGTDAFTYKEKDTVPVILGYYNSFGFTGEIKAVYKGEYYRVVSTTIAGLQNTQLYTPTMFNEFLKEKTVFQTMFFEKKKTITQS